VNETNSTDLERPELIQVSEEDINAFGQALHNLIAQGLETIPEIILVGIVADAQNKLLFGRRVTEYFSINEDTLKEFIRETITDGIEKETPEVES
jgi:hypothetical protein